MDIYCVVTGQNGGKSVFVYNTPIKPVSLALLPGYEFRRIWGSDAISGTSVGRDSATAASLFRLKEWFPLRVLRYTAGYEDECP